MALVVSMARPGTIGMNSGSTTPDELEMDDKTLDPIARVGTIAPKIGFS
jgi:hypothetical protein